MITYFKNIKFIVDSNEYYVFKMDVSVGISMSYFIYIECYSSFSHQNTAGKDAKINYDITYDNKITSSISFDCFVKEISIKKIDNPTYSYQYNFILCSHLYKLSYITKCKVYSDYSISKLISELFDQIDLRNISTKTSYQHKNNYVQFNENCFNFFSRYLNQLGFFYFFDFDQKKWIITDDVNFCGIKNVDFHSFESIKSVAFEQNINFKYKELNNTTVMSRESSNCSNVFKFKSDLFYEVESLDVILPKIKNSTNYEKGLLFYKSDDAKIYPGTIIDKYIVSRLTISCDFEKSQESMIINLCFKDTFLGPKYSCINNRIFSCVVLANQDSVDMKNNLIKVQPFFANNSSEFFKAKLCTFYAGDGYGALFIPRGGNEVLVTFIDDLMFCPIIIGSMYNSKQKHPYFSDDNNSVLFLKTETIGQKGDTSNNIYHNELFFSDESGNEETRISNKNILKVLSEKNIKIHSKVDLDLKTENYEEKINNKKSNIKNKSEIICGTSKIEISNEGIKISGQKLDIDFSIIEINAKSVVKIASNMSLKLEGSIIAIEAKALMNIKCNAMIVFQSAMSMFN